MRENWRIISHEAKITSNENKYSGQFLAKVTRLEQMNAVMQSMDNEDC